MSSQKTKSASQLEGWELADQYARKGFGVVPLYERSSTGVCSCFLGSGCPLFPYHPRIDRSQESASSDPATVRRWWLNWPTALVGIMSGKDAQLAVLQCDFSRKGRQSLQRLEADHRQLPLESRRACGEWGLQYHFRLAKDQQVESADIIDARPGLSLSNGSMCVLAPECLDGKADCLVRRFDELPQIPDWLPRLTIKQSIPGGDSAKFPVKYLPGPLAKLALEGSASLSCPTELIGAPMLAVVASAIGDSRVISVKPDWQERPCIYAAVVADPGAMKSPALKLAAAPMYDRQRRLSKDYDLALVDHERVLDRYEIDKKIWAEKVRKFAQGSVSDPGQSPARPPAPIQQQIYTTDTTVEAVAVVLEQNPRGLLVICDELVHWVRGMDLYKGHGNDRQFWLSIWNGAPERVNRKGDRRAIELDNPLVSVTGCLPPDMLAELRDAQNRADGFIDRILFAYPERFDPRWTYDSVGDETRSAYSAVIQTLIGLKPDRDPSGAAVPKSVELTDTGRSHFVLWVKAHHDELRHPSFPDALRGPWAKFPGYAARLSLILHMARFAAGEAADETVDVDSVEAAIRFAEYFKASTRRALLQIDARSIEQRHLSVLRWIRKQGSVASARDLMRNNVAGLRSGEETRVVLSEMQELGYGRISQGPYGRLLFRIGLDYLEI